MDYEQRRSFECCISLVISFHTFTEAMSLVKLGDIVTRLGGKLGTVFKQHTVRMRRMMKRRSAGICGDSVFFSVFINNLNDGVVYTY